MTQHPLQPDPTGEQRRPMEPHLAAFFAVLLPPITSAIWLKVERDRPFVRFYSWQSLLFGLAVLGGYGVLALVALATRGMPEIGLATVSLGGVFFVMAWLVLWVVQLIAALTGREWEMPFFGPVARKLQKRGQERFNT